MGRQLAHRGRKVRGSANDSNADNAEEVCWECECETQARTGRMCSGRWWRSPPHPVRVVQHYLRHRPRLRTMDEPPESQQRGAVARSASLGNSRYRRTVCESTPRQCCPWRSPPSVRLAGVAPYRHRVMSQAGGRMSRNQDGGQCRGLLRLHRFHRLHRRSRTRTLWQPHCLCSLRDARAHHVLALSPSRPEHWGEACSRSMAHRLLARRRHLMQSSKHGYSRGRSAL